MRIILLGNDAEPQIVEELRKMGEKIIFHADKITLDDLKEQEIEFVISYSYRYIISKEIIDAYKGRIINLHISYLPWNRGAHPNFWSFWEDTPNGVTIHDIDEGIDTGDILAQKQVTFHAHETLKSTYESLQILIQEILIENWTLIRNGMAERKEQTGRGSYHAVRDLEQIWPVIEEHGGWNISINELRRLRTGTNDIE